MKTQYITIMIAWLAIGLVSCDENEELPGFLNGTEFGILLLVDVSSGEMISIDDVNAVNVNFDLSYDDTKRPVQSIAIQKTFVAADGTTSDTIEQMTVATSPSSGNISVSDLVSGISGLDVDDLAAGDSFRIEFIITYVDGLVVDNYGTGVNPNFSVTFI